MPGRTFGSHRYGFQGEYAEKDEETGWNAFELRMMDTRMARWTVIDPYDQYWSPYISMGNDPVNGVDPDGGLFIKLRARIYAARHGIDNYNLEFNNETGRAQMVFGHSETYGYAASAHDLGKVGIGGWVPYRSGNGTVTAGLQFAWQGESVGVNATLGAVQLYDYNFYTEMHGISELDDSYDESYTIGDERRFRAETTLAFAPGIGVEGKQVHYIDHVRYTPTAMLSKSANRSLIIDERVKFLAGPFKYSSKNGFGNRDDRIAFMLGAKLALLLGVEAEWNVGFVKKY